MNATNLTPLRTNLLVRVFPAWSLLYNVFYLLPWTLWHSYLPDWHPADRRIQDSGVRVGAHFGNEGKPLPPANTVFLDLLSVSRKTQQEHINLSDKQFGILHYHTSYELFISKCLSTSAFFQLMMNRINFAEVMMKLRHISCLQQTK